MQVRWRMLGVVALVGMMSAGATTEPTTQADSGKRGEAVELFNGKDLSGWVWFAAPAKGKAATQAATQAASQPAKMEEVWEVRDGVLHSKGKPIGYLRTDKAFGPAYELIVEQRHIKAGNGGVLIGLVGADKIWPGLQIQGLSGQLGDLINSAHFPLTVDASRTKGEKTVRMGEESERPVGEWNRFEIVVGGGKVVVKLNGVVKNVAENGPDMTGFIGLQAEGAEMEFRKIEVRGIQ